MCGDQTITILYLSLGRGWRLESFIQRGPPIARNTSRSDEYRSSSIINVLLVSRLFSAEMASTLYSTTRFTFHTPGTLEVFVDKVPQRHRNLIANLRLNMSISDKPWSHSLEPSRALLRMRGLKDLTVTMYKGGPYQMLEPDEGNTFTEELSGSKKLPRLEHARIQLCNPFGDRGERNEHWNRFFLEGMCDLVAG